MSLHAMVLRAQLQQAPLVVALVRPVAQAHGYEVALTGSTLRHGEGRDYDLILFPTSAHGSPTDNVAAELTLRGATVHGVVHGRGLNGSANGILATWMDYALDITVRERSW